ncbi:hypothetical protein pdam_00022917, partial [Pocillopora damicornis]
MLGKTVPGFHSSNTASNSLVSKERYLMHVFKLKIICSESIKYTALVLIHSNAYALMSLKETTAENANSLSRNVTQSYDSCTGLPCPPGKKTDDPQGRCCVFPFEYGGKTYQSCTKVAHHRLWCSFDEVYKGQWANCVNPCTNSPCQNGGVCTVTGDDSYSCKCADGYYGQTCEK